ncbi:FIST C domain [Micractinium conductrix]|uniref:FIST C domain n=1 Tax=Micractinium conductrix TaxID=554055 RepID=A0A2P6V5G4_9CHLO|nr:FIST C domain [Micractinium conductrix]|eukprot:PSC69328.1 FIST C domain [Micractinium conductrix]
MGDAHLSLLADDLLLKVLHAAGAPAVACAATLCRRLRWAQQELSALPAFAAAAATGDTDDSISELVAAAVRDAREQMHAAIDVCIVFVAGALRGRGDAQALHSVVEECQALLPPGTLVLGCCGRGLFGVERGQPVEIDPSERQARGASVLLGRMPGCVLRAFAAREAPKGGWSSESACSAWLGLQEAGAAAGPGANLQPLSCLIFPHSSAGQDVHGCIEGLQAAYPHMLVTGGISSGQGDLFCSQPVPPLAEESGGARRRPRGVARAKFVGLAICKEEGGDAGSSGVGTGGGSDAPVAGGLAVQGMEGAQPVLSRLVMVRNVGFLEGAGGGPDAELMAVADAQLEGVEGPIGIGMLKDLAYSQTELGLWAGPVQEGAAGPASFDAALVAGEPATLLQLYGVVEGAEIVAAADDVGAFAAVLAQARQPGRTLCAQALRLSSAGALRALTAGVRQLAAACPARHALLPTVTAGLVVVSCTAKGEQLHGVAGVEAGAMHASSGQLPLAGVYADGEIGPTIHNATSVLRWSGRRGGGGSSTSKVQGFTTVITALAAAP